MPQRNLTETFAAQAKATKRTYLWDRRIPGFGMRVSAKGRKTWLFRYRTVVGDQRELKLGLNPAVTANAAREQAMQLAARVHQGEDPALDRIEAKAAAAFNVERLCERFDQVRMSRMSDKTARMYRSMFSNHVLHPKYGIGRLPVDGVGSKEIQSLVDAVASQKNAKTGLRKVGQAKKLKSLLATLFVFAEEEGLRPRGTTPLLGVRVDDRRKEWELPLVEETGHTFEPGESEAVWKALDEVRIYEGAADAIRLIMLTGMRVDEVRLLTWADVSMDEPGARLSVRRHKTQRKLPVKSVPLSAVARDLLRRRGPGLPKAYVFPSVRDPGRPIADLWPPWKKVRDSVGLPRARLHDLRGLAARHLLDAGWSREQIMAFMEWQSAAMVDRYVKASRYTRREGAELVAMGLMGVGTGADERS